ncbi:hypothetical protein ACFQ5N_03655 [Lutibacter holmesii]|uniref:Uncharacterized protein n=1 Tax=Lutibacter holmesii TaxID=1137985 RepID=A0ABW3WL22_9FLAO
METSQLIAKIIGCVYIAFGVGILLNGNYYKKEIPKLLENTSYLIFGGFLAIIFGAIIIENHPFWVKNWTVLITIIGWIALIKGMLLLAFPTTISSFKSLFSIPKIYPVLGVFILIFGLFFTYFGFFS